MNINKDIIRNEEKAIFELRSLYRKYGYTQFKMSKFEEYDLYVRNKDFLVSDSIITFNDTNGRLMALKPDVTLSIVKNMQEGALNKLYYNENVYRIADSTHSFKEIMQTGLECIGDIDIYNICEVVLLAVLSLKAITPDFVLDISHMGFVSSILDGMDIKSDVKKTILKCIAEKNTHELKDICEKNSVNCEKIEKLISTYGDGKKVIAELKPLADSAEMQKGIAELEAVYSFLKANNLESNVRFDFSIVNDMNYYSGIVFKGYIEGIYTSVLSGGEYSKLMHKMKKKSGAIGFAVYLDTLERLETTQKKYDVDTVILYDDGADVCELYKNVKLLLERDVSVLAVKDASNIKFRQLLKFNGKGVEIVEING